jgi:hypothetical protein
MQAILNLLSEVCASFEAAAKKDLSLLEIKEDRS